MRAPAIATLPMSVQLMLKNDPDLLHLGAEGILGFDESGLWIFLGKPENAMQGSRDPQGTGTSSIVISADETQSGTQYNDAQFPILQVLIYSDATRDGSNAQIKEDQRAKAWKLYEVIDNILHDCGNTRHEWFGTYVISSTRSFGPRIEAVPQTDGLVRLMVRYEVKL